MDRRSSLKYMAWGSLATGVLAEACKSADKKTIIDKAKNDASSVSLNRMVEEEAHYKKITADVFFNEHEMATMNVLCDIIIPKDEKSGSASEAKVPDFIEFMVKEKPELQTPVRGGLRWLDLQMLTRYEKSFMDCTPEQRIVMVDEIAYPEKAKPAMKAGVKFFNLMRNLTASGFYTTEMGYKDIGYMGNKPTQWNGVPDDVLKQYGLSYTEKELKECVSFS